MIYITGDCHSDFIRFTEDSFPIQSELTKDDYLIICGDFGGVWSYEKESDREKDALDWLNDRNFSYACKILSNAVEKSQNYKEVTKVIQINLCHLGNTEKGIVKYQIRSEEKVLGFEEVFTEKMEIYVVNVDFYKKMVYNGNKKFICENYLLCALDLSLKEIDKISEGNEILMNFKEELEKINDDEDFVKWMSYEEEQEKIKNTFIKEGFDAGILKTAKNMLNEKSDITFISKVTGLSEKELYELNM